MWFVSDIETPAKKFSATFDFRPRTSFQLPILYHKEREYAKNERNTKGVTAAGKPVT